MPLFGIAGNHGVEPFGESPEVIALVAQWHESLLRDLSKWPGVSIEDKRFSLTVDYRHAPDLEATRDAIHHSGETPSARAGSSAGGTRTSTSRRSTRPTRARRSTRS